METKALIVVMSHLSDIEMLAGIARKQDEVYERCEFAKWICMKHRNLDEYIDPDVEYEAFMNRNK